MRVLYGTKLSGPTVFDLSNVLHGMHGIRMGQTQTNQESFVGGGRVCASYERDDTTNDVLDQGGPRIRYNID